METELKLVSTADGSNTIWNEQIGEHYHSKHGALQESRHVFLASGLHYFLEWNSANTVNILEVGFGTGLNFLLTADYCSSRKISLNYTGIEAFPLSDELIISTGYEAFVADDTWQAFKNRYAAALASRTDIGENSWLEIAHTELLKFGTQQSYDVLYFDAFAAIHQPEMWTENALAHCCQFLKKGGVFVTYAITGNLKRIMKALGFEIEKAPGAPGKREMLRAVKL
ncbi:tRNA (5-methylaminomethyl-2-thiouridine)(34)-methyltransferase MnmD [Desertivirga xinjiangensis]|uniref:tRNA (5-methylaminomethyl-2-thiouridine)(34)-methyltransferase MnmD n=1 Tax=Desertivirga xinjiangensis TaxID=539206 RepID=UPI00210CA534|nr:tRNA (5-methylaminomethyl-2-thiouridine)(34)-methyltransferase MnmD [Pedobacter xinjiangensis]